jgi:oligopeptidase A
MSHPLHAGELPPPRQTRLRGIEADLARLQSKFQDNVVDSVKAWKKHVVEAERLEGMSAHAQAVARADAQAQHLDGFLLSLDPSRYEAVLQGADDRALRHELFESYTTRASDRGPLAGRFDNGPIVDDILALRHEQSRLLGFPNYAELRLQTTRKESADQVERGLLELKAEVQPQARAELEEAWKLAKATDGLKGFRPWDLPYYLEKLKRQRAGVCEGETRQAVDAALRSLHDIEWALFDLRVHRDYVPAERASRLRCHVLDTIAQVRREVSVLPPPPWDRRASSFLDAFGPR